MANRLADAISPYLRSHADNPVDWYPWGSEAFEVARRRDVPVLVSIGYATCHWCHVMARESFSDPTLAEELNSRFVAIKVDREENPEVDTVYMTAAGAFTQNLGWPLNVFVTPDGHPFYAGTYFPPAPIQGVPAFRQVLDAVSEAWTANRAGVRESSGRLAEGIRAAARGTVEVPLPDEDALRAAVRGVAMREDRVHGGFGQQPKFPVSPVLGFLARMRPKDETAGILLDRTLAAMARSGLRDPVEGGFFRYATRADWGEPHYERMLYDNAQLLELYSAAAVQVPDRAHAALFHEVAAGIAAFLIGVMRVRGGGFASAQDSESVVDGERVEGFYYGLDAASRARIAAPALDEKVLTGWNGWAVEALARAGFRLEEPAWISTAEEVADFLLREHRIADGRLVRASLDGRLSDAPATSEDYGGFAGALLTLGALTGRVDYATAGRDLLDESLADRRSGDPLLAAQGMSWTDDPSEGAYPSGPSALAHACVLAHQLTGDGGYRDRAAVLLGGAGDTAQQPFAFGAALATTVALADEVELVVVGADPSLITTARHFRGLVSVVTPDQAEGLASAGFALYEGRTAEAAYYCVGGVCRLPVTSAAELEGILRG